MTTSRGRDIQSTNNTSARQREGLSSQSEISDEADLLLDVRNLHVAFTTEGGVAHAVEGIDLAVRRGETLGLVGESGCGKSVTSLAIMGLVSQPPGDVHADAIELDGTDLLKLNERRMRHIRGGDIAMIFQDPATSLNPMYTVGFQIVEAIRAHRRVSRKEARERAVQLLDSVHIPAPERRIDDYPHQLSGGMRQRAMIAMALAGDPRLLIADEPTTALDVTIQAQMMELFAQIKTDSDMSLLLITHDLGVIAQVADRVAVMYAGRNIETAGVYELFEQPLHPYTRGLIRCVPRPDHTEDDLSVIPGSVPDPAHKPGGCPFHPRCHLADSRCRDLAPPNRRSSADHTVACWKAGGQA